MLIFIIIIIIIIVDCRLFFGTPCRIVTHPSLGGRGLKQKERETQVVDGLF